MAVGESLLSKVIDENDVSAFVRYGIERSHFVTEAERKAYDFVVEYAQSNEGNAPSYATFVGENPEITYIPAVSDSFEYLVRRIKDTAGKRSIAEFFQSDVAELFDSHDTESFISELQLRLDEIKLRTRTGVPIGTNIADDAERFLAEYQARKEGRSQRIWRSKFTSINEQIGGYQSANMYTWYARSGRGKSVVTMEEAIEAAFQGATVLVWALEMSTFEWMARAYSSISAREGVVTAKIDGVDYAAGFENRALRTGQLSDDFERGFAQFLAEFPAKLPGKIIVRGVNDTDFRERGLRQLEADIIETKADVVVVDPFYYLEYERNTSKTTGGDAAATSLKLRQLAGRLDVVVHAITQADEYAKEKDDEGVREMRVPRRDDIKKTKQLLEDAANVFGVDTLAHEGRGVIEIGKGRNGGEDARIELVYLPNYGIVREIDSGIVAEQFASQF